MPIRVPLTMPSSSGGGVGATGPAGPPGPAGSVSISWARDVFTASTSPAVDGATSVYPLQHAPIAGSEHVMAGNKLMLPGIDYTILATTLTTTNPVPADWLPLHILYPYQP